MKKIIYSIIVPVYNEELVINETYIRLKNVMAKLDEGYEIIFINDGSRDKTLLIAQEICSRDSNVKLINFSRNFGHQVAITAGMDNSNGRAIVVIDADLQDPPEVIPEMIKKWKEGYEVVYGKRLKRKGETIFKKITAKIFYRFLKGMTTVNIPVDAGDFRLIDRKVCDALKSLPERNRYVRGLVSWVGFKQIGVDYIRDERFAGETKYPLRKMINFAADAITSFSYKPLRFSTYIGGIMALISFLTLNYVFFQKFVNKKTEPGWASIVSINLFFNGLMLIMLGIIGEYVGRIYDEVKGRPQYIIMTKMGFDGSNQNSEYNKVIDGRDH